MQIDTPSLAAVGTPVTPIAGAEPESATASGVIQQCRPLLTRDRIEHEPCSDSATGMSDAMPTVLHRALSRTARAALTSGDPLRESTVRRYWPAGRLASCATYCARRMKMTLWYTIVPSKKVS